jgi:hypothetical protein
VFNLNEREWSSRATDEQLRDIVSRVKNLQPIAGERPDLELGDFGRVTSPDEVAAIRSFVDAELSRRERRRTSGSRPPDCG